ncbi:hypothetical protein [Methanococcoides methylutens]|uniref:hypothetical protein n=1 Tax=Methanococcoides methylutens TaxID=2226 RepID=UPI00064E157F|nr:hypothetical protein [Methanococcoides methylutens]
MTTLNKEESAISTPPEDDILTNLKEFGDLVLNTMHDQNTRLENLVEKSKASNNRWKCYEIDKLETIIAHQKEFITFINNYEDSDKVNKTEIRMLHDIRKDMNQYAIMLLNDSM